MPCPDAFASSVAPQAGGAGAGAAEQLTATIAWLVWDGTGAESFEARPTRLDVPDLTASAVANVLLRHRWTDGRLVQCFVQIRGALRLSILSIDPGGGGSGEGLRQGRPLGVRGARRRGHRGAQEHWKHGKMSMWSGA